jgi:hypothetical protein
MSGMRAILVGVCLLALAGTALGQSESGAKKVYRWTDARGQVHYSDRPDDDARDVQEMKVKFGAATEAIVPPPAATPEEEARRVAACALKRGQLDSYSNSIRLVEKDSLGREREFTPEERDLLIARTRGEIEQQCADIPETTPEG